MPDKMTPDEWVAVRRATLEEWARMIEVDSTPAQAGPSADDIHALIVNPEAPDVPVSSAAAGKSREIELIAEVRRHLQAGINTAMKLEGGREPTKDELAAEFMGGELEAAFNALDHLEKSIRSLPPPSVEEGGAVPPWKALGAHWGRSGVYRDAMPGEPSDMLINGVPTIVIVENSGSIGSGIDHALAKAIADAHNRDAHPSPAVVGEGWHERIEKMPMPELIRTSNEDPQWMFWAGARAMKSAIIKLLSASPSIDINVSPD